jgi:hypothetical protein
MVEERERERESRKKAGKGEMEEGGRDNKYKSSLKVKTDE